MTNTPTQIVHAWLEAHNCTKQFWEQRAQRWADELPPEDARQRLAEEIEAAMRRSLTSESDMGLWSKLAVWAIDEVAWVELAAQRLAATSRTGLWNRLSHGAACGE